MKKIALIVDTDNWAYANIAKNIVKRLSTKYSFIIIPITYVDNNLAKIWLMVQDFDLVHFFWRGHVFYPNYYKLFEYIDLHNDTWKSFKSKYIDAKRISTDIYDHLFLDTDEEKKVTINYLNNCKNYYVSSSKLYNIYNNLPIKNKPWGIITDAVDLQVFYPQNINRLKVNNLKNRKVVIGWVGNSKWQDNQIDYKGVNTILKPVINELISEGYPLKMLFADRNDKMIPLEKMVDYYAKIDLYICTSLTEGTPNPILEAMACGIPIISTDVGIVKDALGKKQRKYILEERSKQCLKEKIIYLLNHLEDLESLAKENLKSIQRWSWEEKIKDFDKYFTACLERKDN